MTHPEKPAPRRRWLPAVLGLALATAIAGGYLAARHEAGPGPRAALATTSPGFPCGDLMVSLDSIMPGEIPIGINQKDFDCFAWSEFIALNWPTVQGAGLGDPGDMAPVAWETYMPLELLYQPGAATPPSWGTQPQLPPGCQPQARLATGARVLRATSKFETSVAAATFEPGSVSEAAPTDAPAWLGAQNGTNVWYEVRVNRAEYDYVVANGFYDADTQYDSAQAGVPLLLPAGSADSVGTIELKAAWMEVPDPDSARWQRYKLSQAVVVDSTASTCRSVTLALVGLHIIHKTQKQPTWIWATFEHVDNVPADPANPAPGTSYNFFNPGCTQVQVQVAGAHCLPPQITSPVTVGCTPNTPPPYYLGTGCPGPVPIQVTRINPIDTVASNTSAAAWNAIAQAYPQSVWQNYQLVSVIWSTSPVSDASQPKQIPTSVASLQPLGKVANTTLETFVQDSFTCTDCHRYAAIAPTATDTAPQWPADFSFALGAAHSSSSSGPTVRRRRPRPSP